MSEASLLIVTGRPYEENQVELCLQLISEGLSRLDGTRGRIDWNTELLNFLNKNVPPEDTDEGGLLLRLEGKVYIEVLISPTLSQLRRSLHHFFTHKTQYKHLVHAGPVVSGSGDWFLKDAFFTVADLGKVVNGSDISYVLKEICPGSKIVVCCVSDGHWNETDVKQQGLNQNAEFVFNPAKAGPALRCLSDVSSYLAQFLKRESTELTEMMKRTKVIGNVTLKRPTVYIFPGGQGDAALIGIRGFNLLVDGGYGVRASYWDFVRHLDRVDALLLSRMTPESVFSTSYLLRRLKQDPECHPRLGYFFGNLPPRSAAKPECLLEMSVFEETGKIAASLTELQLKATPVTYSLNAKKCPEAINLFYKVGHGKLDMYPLNPPKDSKEMKDLHDQWKKAASAVLFGSEKNSGAVPLAYACSVAVMLVWVPADPLEETKKILLPGSCPQEKLFASLEKMRNLDFMKPSLSPSKKVRGPPPKVAPKLHTAGALSSDRKKPKSPPPQPETTPVPDPVTASSPPAVRGGAPAAADLLPRDFRVPQPSAVREQEVRATTEETGLHQMTVKASASVQIPLEPTKSESSAACQSDEPFLPKPASVSPGLPMKTEAFNCSNPFTSAPVVSPPRQSDEGRHDPAIMEDSLNVASSTKKSQVFGANANAMVCQPPAAPDPIDAGGAVPHDPQKGSDAARLTGGGNEVFDPLGTIEEPVVEDFRQKQGPEFPGSLDDTQNTEVCSPATPEMDFSKADSAYKSRGDSNLEEAQEFTGLRLDDGSKFFGGQGSEAAGIPDHAAFVEGDTGAPDEPVGSPCGLSQQFKSLSLNERADRMEGTPVVSEESSVYFTPKGESATKEHPSPPAIAENSTTPKPSLEELQKEWGEPLGLPPPPAKGKKPPASSATSKANDPVTKSTGSARKPPAPAATASAAAGRGAGAATGRPASSRAPPPSKSTGLGRPAQKSTAYGGPVTKKPPPALTAPVEVDLAYIPHLGKNQSVDADFFRLVRSKNYVLSSIQPSSELLDALLAGKIAWNQQDVEARLIPTHDTDSLHLWMRLKSEELDREGIIIEPSAARCQINMEQGGSGDVCAAYRLEL